MARRAKTKGVVAAKIRLDADVVDQLQKAAKQHGISFNAEAATRIGRSFAEEKEFGGAEGRHIVNLMVSTFVVAGQRAAGANQKISQWINDAEPYRAGTIAVCEALLATLPDSERMMVVESLKGRVATRIINRGGTL